MQSIKQSGLQSRLQMRASRTSELNAFPPNRLFHSELKEQAEQERDDGCQRE